MNVLLKFCAAVAVCVLAACSAPEPEVFSAALTAKNASGAQSGAFDAGEPITLALVSANNTDQPQAIQWCGGGRFDLAVHSDDGTLVWNLYYETVFTAALQNDVYGPREERGGAHVWSQVDNSGNSVPPGHYYAIADGCAYHDQERIAAFRTEPVDFLIH